MIEKILSRSMRLMFTGGVVASMGSMALPAMAQEKKIESVVVTGTRITTPGTTSNSPISSISAAEIQSSQPVAVEEFFKTLPAAVPAVGPGTNNGTGGAATINLRGLGSNRTLVLLNGRRIVPFDLDGQVDTNSIPVALINRTDLLTGGASVAYGADAVSGVVNFNLKKNFKGFEVNSSYGTTAKSDAKRDRTDITMGASLDDGKGNVALSLGRTSVKPLTQSERSYGQFTTDSITGIPSGSPGGETSGSPTTAPGIFKVVAGPGGTNVLPGEWQMDPTSGKLVQPAKYFNFNPVNYYVTGLERQQVTALGNYKINDNFDFYSEVFYTNSKVDSTLAESGSFLNTYNVPIGNPFIPAAARAQICQQRGIDATNCVVGNTTMVPMDIGRRFVEMGARLANYDNKTLQYTVGTKGDLAGDWTYDAYFTRGTADQIQINRNWGSASKLKQGLNSVQAGKCVDPSGGCVPINLFGGVGSLTPEQIKYFNLGTMLITNIVQEVASFSTSGSLGKIKSPWATQEISVAVSAEQRKVTASNTSDSATQIQGEVLGTGAPRPDRSGTMKLKEYALEMNIPLLSNKPMIRSLNLDIGYRQTNFNSGTQVKDYGSYKYGGDWEPVKQFRLRGMIQQATRAPNVNELFAPVVTSLGNAANDPCQLNLVNQAEANTAGTLSNLCRLTGVPVSVLGNLAKPAASQVNQQTGGNPGLGPEKAKTKTLGFVFEPLPKLAVSLDYYKIDITEAISSAAISDLLDGCYATKFNPSYAFNAACALIGRNPGNGSFNGVESKGIVRSSSNLGKQSTSGYDFGVNYQLPLSSLGADPKIGRLDLNLALTKVQTYHRQPTPGSIDRDCLGFYSTACGAPNFKTKFTQRATWSIGEFTLGYNWRYLGSAVVEPLANLNAKKEPVYFPAFSKIDAYNYVDLNASWNFNKQIRLSLSINNATNKQPPAVGATIAGTGVNSGNTFPQSYDAVGRYFNLGATIKF